MAIIRPQFNCKKYEKIDIFDCKYTEGLKQYFKDCSNAYSDYLSYYFAREGGVISGFRFTNVGR